MTSTYRWWQLVSSSPHTHTYTTHTHSHTTSPRSPPLALSLNGRTWSVRAPSVPLASLGVCGGDLVYLRPAGDGDGSDGGGRERGTACGNAVAGAPPQSQQTGGKRPSVSAHEAARAAALARFGVGTSPAAAIAPSRATRVTAAAPTASGKPAAAAIVAQVSSMDTEEDHVGGPVAATASSTSVASLMPLPQGDEVCPPPHTPTQPDPPPTPPTALRISPTAPPNGYNTAPPNGYSTAPDSCTGQQWLASMLPPSRHPNPCHPRASISPSQPLISRCLHLPNHPRCRGSRRAPIRAPCFGPCCSGRLRLGRRKA